jgi:hypothetical protein
MIFVEKKCLPSLAKFYLPPATLFLRLQPPPPPLLLVVVVGDGEGVVAAMERPSASM